MSPLLSRVKPHVRPFCGCVLYPLFYILVLSVLTRPPTSRADGLCLPVTVVDYAHLLVVMIAFAVAIGVGWQCHRTLLRADRDLPAGRSRLPLVLHVLCLLTMVAERTLAVTGWQPLGTTLALLAVMYAAAVTQLGFVAAGAAVEAEFRGLVPGQWLLTVAYNVGGFGGIALARRLFRDSAVLTRFRPGLPVVAHAVLALTFALVIVTTGLPLKLLQLVEPPFRVDVIPPGNDYPRPEGNAERGGGPVVPQFGGAPPGDHLPGIPPGFTSPYK